MEHVYEKLKAIEEKIDDLMERDADRRVSIAKLEVKSGFWGAIGGAIVAITHFVFK